VTSIFGDGRVVTWILSGTRIDKVYGYAPTVIARIIKELRLPVIVHGAPVERDQKMAERVRDVVQMHNGSLEGLHFGISDDPEKPHWPLRRVLSQVLQSDLVIAPDTGPLWAAAFEPMPKIALLSHAGPNNITRHHVNTITLHADQSVVPCSPCHRLHDSPATCVAAPDGHQAACMADISTECLLTAVRASLGDDEARSKLTTRWKSRATISQRESLNG